MKCSFLFFNSFVCSNTIGPLLNLGAYAYLDIHKTTITVFKKYTTTIGDIDFSKTYKYQVIK